MKTGAWISSERRIYCVRMSQGWTWNDWHIAHQEAYEKLKLSATLSI